MISTREHNNVARLQNQMLTSSDAYLTPFRDADNNPIDYFPATLGGIQALRGSFIPCKVNRWFSTNCTRVQLVPPS